MKQYSKDDDRREIVRKEYRDDRFNLRLARERAVEDAMHRALTMFEESLSRNEFKFSLKRGPQVETKTTYQINPSLDVIFPAKEAADSVKKAAHIETPSRNSIVRALKSVLDKRYTHAVYRIDVKEFFESIPHSTLLERLSTYPSLDSVSLQLSTRLLTEFATLNGSNVGLPRGVGLSSHLAEVYLSDFDSKLRTHPGVLFCARYVDDVVIVLEGRQTLEAVKTLVADELRSLGLQLNGEKTYELVSDTQGNYPEGRSIDYLGYSFSRRGGQLATGLTEKRKGRRMKKLELAFRTWLDTTPDVDFPKDGHNGLLVDRVRYLAGNTKLINSKSNVAIGLYFSNSALESGAVELVELDQALQKFLQNNSSMMPIKMRNRLNEVSFVKFFNDRHFLRFKPRRIEQIVSIWEGVA